MSGAVGDGLWGRLRGLTGLTGRDGAARMPSFALADLLEQGRAAKPAVSALDAVMGKDWAVVEAGRAGRAPVVRAGIAAAHRRDVARHPGGGMPGRRPQAVVKMIRQGGASDLRGMRAQMAYLSRQGEEPLQRSERYMGLEIDAEQAALLESAWRMPAEEREGGADRTTHFIVSFPEGTDTAAAERAGRAWAEELFGSGKYCGDSFDYYTAFHTDRAHPHMHVVVHRRGLENGEWLKVSLRSDLNYDRMRDVLVEVAGREGIALEATPRLARGIHDRVIPDAEYRRAGIERRAPAALEHSPETALRAAAGLIHHARGADAAAREVELTDPAQAERLRAAGLRLGKGRELTPTVWGLPEPAPRTGIPARITEAHNKTLEDVADVERDLIEIGDPVTRVRLMRDVAELKAETCSAMGAKGRFLHPYTVADDSGRYDGLAGTGRDTGLYLQMTNKRIAGVAKRYGVNGAALAERFSGGIPSKGLAQDFRTSELLERKATRAGQGVPAETDAQAAAALDRMHAEIDAIHALVRAGRSPYADINDRWHEKQRAEAARQQEQFEARRAAQEREQAETARRLQDHQARQTAERAQADAIEQARKDRERAERAEAVRREEAERRQAREDAERARRERDGGGRGL